MAPLNHLGPVAIFPMEAESWGAEISTHNKGSQRAKTSPEPFTTVQLLVQWQLQPVKLPKLQSSSN